MTAAFEAELAAIIAAKTPLALFSEGSGLVDEDAERFELALVHFARSRPGYLGHRIKYTSWEYDSLGVLDDDVDLFVTRVDEKGVKVREKWYWLDWDERFFLSWCRPVRQQLTPKDSAVEQNHVADRV